MSFKIKRPKTRKFQKEKNENKYLKKKTGQNRKKGVFEVLCLFNQFSAEKAPAAILIVNKCTRDLGRASCISMERKSSTFDTFFYLQGLVIV